MYLLSSLILVTKNTKSGVLLAYVQGAHHDCRLHAFGKPGHIQCGTQAKTFSCSAQYPGHESPGAGQVGRGLVDVFDVTSFAFQGLQVIVRLFGGHCAVAAEHRQQGFVDVRCYLFAAAHIDRGSTR